MEAVLLRLGKSSEVMALKVPHTMSNALFVLLAKQIYNRIRVLSGFDLARNIHFHQNVDWSGETHNG
jgi:hypothetical protein